MNRDHNQCLSHPAYIKAKEKTIETWIKKQSEYIEKYNLNPVSCHNCHSVLDYDRRNNKFCNRSCSASFKNRNWIRSESTKEKQREILKRVKPIPIERSPNLCRFCETLIFGKRKTCSNECLKQLQSKLGKDNPHIGGNRNNRAYGWYTSHIAGDVYLESSYEYRVAKELDDNGITWTRPKCLNYGNKRYFPDFYLVDYDIYLDPKNDYLIDKDRDKILSVIEENKVRIIVLNKDQLSWLSILSLL